MGRPLRRNGGVWEGDEVGDGLMAGRSKEVLMGVLEVKGKTGDEAGDESGEAGCGDGSCGVWAEGLVCGSRSSEKGGLC